MASGSPSSSSHHTHHHQRWSSQPTYLSNHYDTPIELAPGHVVGRSVQPLRTTSRAHNRTHSRTASGARSPDLSQAIARLGANSLRDTSSPRESPPIDAAVAISQPSSPSSPSQSPLYPAHLARPPPAVAAAPPHTMTPQEFDRMQIEVDHAVDSSNAEASATAASLGAPNGSRDSQSQPTPPVAVAAGHRDLAPVPPADSPVFGGLVSVPEDTQMHAREFDSVEGSSTAAPSPSAVQGGLAAMDSRQPSPSDWSQPHSFRPRLSEEPDVFSSSPAPNGVVLPSNSAGPSRRHSDAGKPLPGVSTPISANAEQSFLPLAGSNGGHSSYDSAHHHHHHKHVPDLPPQHIPRPISRSNQHHEYYSSSPSSSVVAPQGSRNGLPPSSSHNYRNGAAVQNINTGSNGQRFDSPMSPPDADPGRTMAESNRSSIDDIRRMHAQRAAKAVQGAVQATPEHASQSMMARRTAPHSEPGRPASVVDTRSSRQDAAAMAQRHRYERPRSSGNALDASSTRSDSDRDTAADRSHSERDRDRERRLRRTLGDYALGKTLGAGSMGKVKLGVKMGSGEKVAIKIIPRHTSIAAAQNPKPSSDGKVPPPPNESYLAKAAAKDHSKEVRTIREGSLQILLHHPYVCGMREMIIHPNHYYMVFEYINGGQMLDYIISHGRLRERAARKFARQIGSALEYCHRNSIVHRDLKIENILISKTGNIKIIDFGLSNLFSPHSHLSTFCGSLYFAAPELLNAKVYTGPEVDVWSFGIVLYVLVCGKVPFDDQSMPALHAKIKRGQVEYPAWLSGECKHVLSRMLVTDPSKRATLPEILSHPWMVRGYDGAPNAHLAERKPLRAGALDPEVIKGMTGFEFGSPDEIEQRLTEVLTSEVYQTVLSAWDAKHSPATSVNGLSESSALGRATTRSSQDSKSKTGSKRFSGIDFYKRKIMVFGNREDSVSSGTLTSGNLNGSSVPTWPGAGKEPLDPTRGFHPLISIYYLVAEKMERERLYGHSFFASSNASLLAQSQASGQTQAHGAPVAGGPATRPASAVIAGNTSSMPTTADIPQEALRVPEASYVSHRGSTTSSSRKEMPAPPRSAVAAPPSLPSSPTPVFDSREKSKPLANMAGPPRARANGDEVEAALREKGIVPAPGWNASSSQRPSTDVSGQSAAGPPPAQPISVPTASNHHRSLSLSMKKPKTSAGFASHDETGATGTSPSVGASPVTLRNSRKVSSPENRRSIHVMPGQGMPGAVTTPEPSSPATPSTGSSLVRRFGSLLGRSPSNAGDSEAREKRKSSRMSTGGIPPSTSTRRAGTLSGGVDESAERLNALALAETEETGAESGDRTRDSIRTGTTTDPSTMDTATAASSSSPANNSGTIKRSGTVQGLSTPTKERDASGKAFPRRESTLPPHASVGRAMGMAISPGGAHARRPSTVIKTDDKEMPRIPGESGDSAQQTPLSASPVADRGGWQGPITSQAQADMLSATLKPGSHKPSHAGAALTSKPVFLKGLFSVQTTSTKPRATITADLVRVLDRIGVQYREIRGGYECVHLPSIDYSGAGEVGTPGQGNARIPIEQGSAANGEVDDGAVATGDASSGRPHGPRRKQSRMSVLSGFMEKRRDSSQVDGSSVRNSPEVPSRSRASSLMFGSNENVPGVAAEGGARASSSPKSSRVARQRTDSLGAPSFFAASTASPTKRASTSHETTGGTNGAVSPVPAAAAAARPPTAMSGAAPSSGTALPSDLVVRFEIFVVKVPLLLGVNGLQFRRVAGNPWQYQMLAKRVLQELKL